MPTCAKYRLCGSVGLGATQIWQYRRLKLIHADHSEKTSLLKSRCRRRYTSLDLFLRVELVELDPDFYSFFFGLTYGDTRVILSQARTQIWLQQGYAGCYISNKVILLRNGDQKKSYSLLFGWTELTLTLHCQDFSMRLKPVLFVIEWEQAHLDWNSGAMALWHIIPWRAEGDQPLAAGALYQSYRENLQSRDFHVNM